VNDTAIAWTDVTWNPASGCQKVSEGCKHCYAETLAENKRGTAAFPRGFELTLRPHKLREPFKLKTPSLVFVNSMSDLFWDQIPTAYVDQIVDVIEQTPQHQYQVLTKRPDRMLAYSRRRKLPGNFWAGVTIEATRFVSRADTLREVDAEIRFISAEPLLSALIYHTAGRSAGPGPLDLGGIDWVIVGGESGTHLADPEKCAKHALVTRDASGWHPRPQCAQWVRDIRDACEARSVAFFFKQWGGIRPTSNGKTLDGREHHAWPRLPGTQPQSTMLPHVVTAR
jgi:protein gp37